MPKRYAHVRPLFRASSLLLCMALLNFLLLIQMSDPSRCATQESYPEPHTTGTSSLHPRSQRLSLVPSGTCPEMIERKEQCLL